MILLAIAAVLATGASTLALLRTKTSTGLGLLGYAFFTGVVVLALGTHLFLFVRIPVTVASLLAIPLILGATALWKRAWPRPASMFGKWSPWSIPLILSAAMAVAGALLWGGLDYDPMLFYLLKAKSIAHYGTVWNPDFTDLARLHLAGRRPLLLPSIYADFFLLASTQDARLLRLWFALIYLGTLGVVSERLRPPLPWLGVLALLPALWHPGGVSTGYGDFMLGILFLAGFDAFRKREPAAAILWFSAAVLLKQDALPFLIALPLATSLALPRDLPRAVSVLAGPAAVALAWLILARRFPWSFDFNPDQFSTPNLIASIRHWPYVLRRIATDTVRFDHWGLFWFLWIGVLALEVRRLDREDARWLLTCLFQLLAYVAVMATYDDQEIVGATRIQKMRLMLHVVPPFWAWGTEKWKSPSLASTPVPA